MPCYWYNGQYDQNGDQTLFEQAVCFLEFMPLNFLRGHLDAQMAVVQFDVHIVQESIGGDDDRVIGIDHLEKVDDVFLALQSFSAKVEDVPGYVGLPDNTVLINPIVRVGLSPDHRMSNILASVMRFETSAWFYNAVKVGQPVNVSLQLQTIVQTP
jgi:hypothetical protein